MSRERMYQGSALAAQDELDVITRRQAMRVIERVDLDQYELREQSRGSSAKVAWWCFVLMFVVSAAAFAIFGK